MDVSKETDEHMYLDEMLSKDMQNKCHIDIDELTNIVHKVQLLMYYWPILSNPTVQQNLQLASPCLAMTACMCGWHVELVS